MIERIVRRSERLAGARYRCWHCHQPIPYGTQYVRTVVEQEATDELRSRTFTRRTHIAGQCLKPEKLSQYPRLTPAPVEILPDIEETTT